MLIQNPTYQFFLHALHYSRHYKHIWAALNPDAGLTILSLPKLVGTDILEFSVCQRLTLTMWCRADLTLPSPCTSAVKHPHGGSRIHGKNWMSVLIISVYSCTFRGVWIQAPNRKDYGPSLLIFSRSRWSVSFGFWIPRAFWNLHPFLRKEYMNSLRKTSITCLPVAAGQRYSIIN